MDGSLKADDDRVEGERPCEDMPVGSGSGLSRRFSLLAWSELLARFPSSCLVDGTTADMWVKTFFLEESARTLAVFTWGSLWRSVWGSLGDEFLRATPLGTMTKERVSAMPAASREGSPLELFWAVLLDMNATEVMDGVV